MLRITTGECFRRGIRHTEGRRVDLKGTRFFSFLHTDGIGDGRGGDFIQAVAAVDDERAPDAEPLQCAGDKLQAIPRIDTKHLEGRTGRIGQRPQQVEDAAHAQLAADRGGMFHGRMMSRREEKADAGLVNAVGHFLRGDVEFHTEGLQHISTTGLR